MAQPVGFQDAPLPAAKAEEGAPMVTAEEPPIAAPTAGSATEGPGDLDGGGPPAPPPRIAGRISSRYGGTRTPEGHIIHDSASEADQYDEFDSCDGITDAAAQRLAHLESAHGNLANQVDHIQDSVNQLLASQASLSDGLVKVGQGLDAAATTQQLDRDNTNNTLQLLLRKLQQGNAPIQVPTGPSAHEPPPPTADLTGTTVAAPPAAPGPPRPRPTITHSRANRHYYGSRTCRRRDRNRPECHLPRLRARY